MAPDSGKSLRQEEWPLLGRGWFPGREGATFWCPPLPRKGEGLPRNPVPRARVTPVAAACCPVAGHGMSRAQDRPRPATRGPRLPVRGDCQVVPAAGRRAGGSGGEAPGSSECLLLPPSRGPVAGIVPVWHRRRGAREGRRGPLRPTVPAQVSAEVGASRASCSRGSPSWSSGKVAPEIKPA